MKTKVALSTIILITLNFAGLIYFISNTTAKEPLTSPFTKEEPNIQLEDPWTITQISNTNSKEGPFNYEEWHINPTKPKKTINVKMVDFWKSDPSDDKEKCFLCPYLSKAYNINFTDEPDFLFYSVFGKKHTKYKKCVKILFSGENVVPDFNYCDYAISLNNIDFYGRHFKYSTLLGMRDHYSSLNSSRKLDRNMTKRKFCNFVYSNSLQDLEGVRLRGKFFKLLSEYKHVDSPGVVFNNMKDAIVPRNGSWRDGKIDFIKDYKFTIAFESSNTYGYTTEKLSDPLIARSIPIYFGNPESVMEYNKKSFIYVNDYKSLKDVVNKVIELDNDDDAYMKMLSEQPLIYPEYNYDEELSKFLTKIIERGNKPFVKNPNKFAWYVS